MIIIFDHVCTFLPLCPLLFIIVPYSFPICDSIDTRNLNGHHGHLGIKAHSTGESLTRTSKSRFPLANPWLLRIHDVCIDTLRISEELANTCENT